MTASHVKPLGACRPEILHPVWRLRPAHNLAPCRPMPTATSSHAAVRDANPTSVETSDSADPMAIIR